MAKHINAIWPSRPLGTHPNSFVRTADKKQIELSFSFAKDKDGIAFNLTRHDAKMLARRINECLEYTK